MAKGKFDDLLSEDALNHLVLMLDSKGHFHMPSMEMASEAAERLGAERGETLVVTEDGIYALVSRAH